MTKNNTSSFQKKKSKARTGGRPLLPEFESDISRLFADRKPKKELLIEYLHLIQDEFGALKHGHLQALAAWMRISMSEVFEVASFYAHFRIVENNSHTPQNTLRVCNTISCCMQGSSELLSQIKNHFAQDNNIQIEEAPCMGRCDQGPVVSVGTHYIPHANLDKINDVLRNPPSHVVSDSGLDDYIKNGGYNVLRQCKEGKLSREHILSSLENSGLRGMGGAGFPTFKKWHAVSNEKGPKYLCVNADEGEPGTFKDFYCLSSSPHRMLEGMLIASWFIEAKQSIIYLRDEYPETHALLHKALHELKHHGLINENDVLIRRGAGAYICGEESAMIESIEGKRGLPRHRPPYVAAKGLWGYPTLVHNVETLDWIPDIINHENGWFSSFGRNNRKGLRRFSVSGRVKEPGVKTAPAGITLRELIDEFCGGMLDNHSLQGYLPGGASGGILPASMDNIPLDFDTLQPHGCFIGSAAVIVFSDKDNVCDVARNMLEFFAHESCGQCTPCRAGTEKAVTLMSHEHWNIQDLKQLSFVMREASICGLGQAAPNPFDCVIRYFKESLS
jgi:formate dehydrogenase